MAINQGSKAGHATLVNDINDRATHTELTNAINAHDTNSGAHAPLHGVITGEITAAVNAEQAARDAAIMTEEAVHNADPLAHLPIRNNVALVQSDLNGHKVDPNAHPDIRGSFGNYATHYEVTHAIEDEINRSEQEYVHKVNLAGEFYITAKRTGTSPGTADWTLHGDEHGRLFWGSIDITHDVAGMDLKSAQTVLPTGVKTFQSDIYKQDVTAAKGETTRTADDAQYFEWIDRNDRMTAEIISNFKAGGGSEFIIRSYRDHAMDYPTQLTISYPVSGTPYMTGPSITNGTASKIVTQMDLGPQTLLITASPDALNPQMGTFDKTTAELKQAIAQGLKLFVKLRTTLEDTLYFEHSYVYNDGTDFMIFFSCCMSGPEIQEMQYDGGISKYYIEDTRGENKFRYTYLPTADASLQGKIYQYIGNTTSSYTHGYFYECVGSPTSPPVYSWEQRDVQPRPAGVFEIIGTPDATDPDKGTFNKTAAEIRAAKTERKHIVLTIDGGGTSTTHLDLIEYSDDGTVLILSFDTTYAYSDGIFHYQVDWDSNTSEYTFSQINGELQFRDTSLPTASSEYLGKIWQYTGNTTASYTKGHFYECVSNGATPPVYSWSEAEVQKVSGIFEITGTADPGDPTQGTFNKTLAEIRAAKAQGCHFVLKIAVAGEDIYYDLMSYYDDSSNFVMNFIQQVPDTKGKEVGINFDGSTLKYQVIDIFLEERFRYSSLPTATIYNEGQIVQYTGNTTTTAPIYKNGHFYKSVFLGAGVYAWQEVEVQNSGGIFIINATETSMTTGTFDKTPAEIKAAYNEGKLLVVRMLVGTHDYYYYTLLHYYEDGDLLIDFVMTDSDTKGRGLFIQYSSTTLSYNMISLYYEELFRYGTMPAASAGNEGKIYQYTGATTSSYTQGHFYKSVSNGATPPVYSWQEVTFGDTNNIYEIIDTLGTKSFSDGKTAEVHAKLRNNQPVVMKYEDNLYYLIEYYDANDYVRACTIRDNTQETKYITFIFASDDLSLTNWIENNKFGIDYVSLPYASAISYMDRYVINTSPNFGNYIKGFLYNSNGSVFKDVLEQKLNVFKTLPAASAYWDGIHAMYAGTTSGDYIKGRFYICKLDTSSTPNVYRWMVEAPVFVDDTTLALNADDILRIKEGGYGQGVALSNMEYLPAITTPITDNNKRIPVIDNTGEWSYQNYISDTTPISGCTLTSLYDLADRLAAKETKIYTNIRFASGEGPTSSSTDLFTVYAANNNDGTSGLYSFMAVNQDTGLSYKITCTSGGLWSSWKQITRNVIYSTTTPSDPVEGDIWVNPNGTAPNVYSKTDADNKFISKGVADVGWTDLTLSWATAGTIKWCCKNNIVFIEGSGVEWPAGTGIKILATGIPVGYRASIECKGVLYKDYGATPVGMVWVYNSATVSFWGTSAAVSDAGGRLFVSYPIL